jgi:hypothetical protein
MSVPRRLFDRLEVFYGKHARETFIGNPTVAGTDLARASLPAAI